MVSRSAHPVLVAIAVVVLAISARPGWAQTYTVTPVDGGAALTIVPQAFNSATQIAGLATRGPTITAGQDPQGYVWQASKFRYLNALHGQAGTQALAINATGQVAGESCATAGHGGCSGVLWQGNIPLNLGFFIPIAINDSGDLYGVDFRQVSGASVRHQGVVTPLPVPSDTIFSDVYAANDAGQVSGLIYTNTDPNAPIVDSAVIWQGNTITYLAQNADPYAINESGAVAGSQESDNGTSDAVVWDHSSQTKLPTLGGASAAAYSINKFGAVVGYAQAVDGSHHAALWSNGGVIDLNAKLVGQVPDTVTGYAAKQINDLGQITVGASDSKTGNYYTYLLTPTGVTQPTAQPTFSVLPRTYASVQQVQLGDAMAGAAIYYTTDGTTPTLAATRYTAPVVVSATTTLKAIAAAGSGFAPSGIATATYTIAIPNTAVPVVVLATPNVNATSTLFTNPHNGGIDRQSAALAADLVGTSLNWGGTQFTFRAPDIQDATANATLALPPGRFGNIQLLALGVRGNQPHQTFTVTYTDGSTQAVIQDISDWATPQSYSGEAIALTMEHRITPTGTFSYGPYHIYGYSLSADPTKQLQSLTTPVNSNVVVLGVAESNPAGGEVRVDLTDAFNVTGVYDPGQAIIGGGLDQLNNAYAETLLGTALSWSGSLFQLGSAGFPNAVSRSTVALPAGKFSTLRLLAAGVRGNQAVQRFTVTYTDGTSQTVIQSLSDWHTPQHYAGEAITASLAYRLDPNGDPHTGPYNLYGYALAIDSSKTAKTITLPPTANVVALAMTLVP